jgi:hypothetical protein
LTHEVGERALRERPIELINSIGHSYSFSNAGFKVAGAASSGASGAFTCRYQKYDLNRELTSS